MALFFKGCVLGLSVAAPVGPIGVLCIRRSITEGRLVGFVSGLGAATADAGSGALGGAGLTVVADFLVRQQRWLGLVGGGFLCWMGGSTFRSRPADHAASADARGLGSACFTTFALTSTDPMTILSFAELFAGAGSGEAAGSPAAAALLVAGVEPHRGRLP